MGDFNINFLTNDEHVTNLMIVMSNYGLQLCIDQPTRKCNTTATLIGHVWVNHPHLI